MKVALGVSLVLFLSATVALAARPPTTREAYCAMASDLGAFKELVNDERNLLAFTNSGGLAEGGVCWWHSRFQRAATYLTVFKPELPAPDEKQVKKIIDELVGKKRVVEIPGFANLREFSARYEEEIQARLEKWQKVDGFAKQYWIDGLWGSATQEENKFGRTIEKLHELVEVKKQIVYAKLQVPGIASHALLIVKVTPMNGGYDLTVLDSNFIGPQTYEYRRGMESFGYPGFTEFVPYPRHDGELLDAQVEMLRYCRPRVALEKWKRALARKSLTREEKILVQYNLDLYERTGQFGDLHRQLTLEAKDREPAAWRELMTGR